MALFDFDITACKTTQKWQKESYFTTPVPAVPTKQCGSIISIS